jgi:hypothetical protein
MDEEGLGDGGAWGGASDCACERAMATYALHAGLDELHPVSCGDVQAGRQIITWLMKQTNRS